MTSRYPMVIDDAVTDHICDMLWVIKDDIEILLGEDPIEDIVITSEVKELETTSSFSDMSPTAKEYSDYWTPVDFNPVMLIYLGNYHSDYMFRIRDGKLALRQ